MIEGMKLNPNEKIVKGVKRQLERCEGYCPCVKDSIGKEEHKCPCKIAREEKICHCKLYVIE